MIGIAVHAETKCRYCTLFHTEAAKLFGATEEEIQEAAHYAKYTVGWSAYLNGMRQDYDEFRRELNEVTEYMSQQAEETAGAEGELNPEVREQLDDVLAGYDEALRVADSASITD